MVLAWELPKLTIIPKGKPSKERRYGSGYTFEFGRRVELKSLEKPQLQLHLRLLLPYQKPQETISDNDNTRPFLEKEKRRRGDRGTLGRDEAEDGGACTGESGADSTLSMRQEF